MNETSLADILGVTSNQSFGLNWLNAFPSKVFYICRILFEILLKKKAMMDLSLLL